MFTIEFAENAERHMASLRAFDRKRLFDEIESQLTHQPDVPTRNRKQLDDHPLADWELRVGDGRVFYDIDTGQRLVTIVAVGRKVGNRLLIDDKEFKT